MDFTRLSCRKSLSMSRSQRVHSFVCLGFVSVLGTPKFSCPACVRCLVKTDVLHSRDPDTCRYPMIASIVWKCPACIASKPMHHRGHTLILTECRGATTPHSEPIRMRTKDPRVGASSEPSSSMRQGAPEPDAPEAVAEDTFEAQQDKEAHAAAAAAQ